MTSAGPEGYEAIIDLRGGPGVWRWRRILTRDGCYVASTGSGGDILGPVPRLLGTIATSPFVSQRLRVLVAKRNTEDLTQLAEMAVAGTIKPVIERQYDLSETAEAIRFIESEHPRGKIVLTVL